MQSLLVRGALLPVPNDPIEDGDRVFRVIKVGAAAYLRKTIESADLLSTIGQVARGEYPITRPSYRAARPTAP
jgi:DNA-binding NarL/FixJ family response regulator